MRRFVLIFLITLMITGIIGQVGVYVNGKQVEFPDQGPFIEKGHVLIPIRFVVENLGAEVSWNNRDREVSINRDDVFIRFKIGDEYANINGQSIDMKATPIIYNNRTMVPLRFIVNVLNENVRWDHLTKTVFIEDEEDISYVRPSD